MIKISNYKNEDFPGLCELMKHWGEDYIFTDVEMQKSISNIQQHPDNKIFIAKDGDEIVGYAQTARCYWLGFDPFVEVYQLLVSEQRRSSGIGGLLMKHIEYDAQKENISVVKLSSQVQRSRAHVFYEELGYAYVKISKFYEKKL